MRPVAGLGVGASGRGATVNHIHIQGAIDPVSTAKQVQKVLLSLDRTNGGGGLKLG